MTRSTQWSTMHVILYSESSNLHMSFRVHTIIPSSLHLPCFSANLAIHSYRSIGKVQKNTSCIYVYKYLYNHYSFVRCGFLFSCAANLWIFLSNHFSVSSLVRLQWCDITHIFMQIQILTMEPFFGLGGPNLGSELVAPNKSLHYWTFQHQSMVCRLNSHLKQYGGMLEPSFHTQRLVWCPSAT